MTAQIKKMLKDHLDRLTAADLRIFKWHLINEEKVSRNIPRSKLENVTTEETVDRLVQTYREWGAVEITKLILCQMNNNELASKLFQATGLKVDQLSHEMLSSPARETQKDADSTLTKTPTRIIREKREAFERVKQFCDSLVEHTKSQRRETEKKIRDDFEALHGFLKEEEEARIAALEEEETEKIDMMQKIIEMSSYTFSLSDSLKHLEKLGMDDPFIEDFRAHAERTQKALPDPQQLPRTLIDVSKHVENLRFRVLKGMLRNVKHTPVVLDPNTASPWLTLSDDLTTVTLTDNWQQRPGNPERNTSHPEVLGREGFDSGKHCWEVVVGSQTGWILGVAEEAIDIKEEMWATPRRRLFTVKKCKTGYKDVKGNTLKLPMHPKIRIELDCDNGRVSFHDADNNTSIHTYEEKFTQKLYPYFAFEKKQDDNNDDDDEGVKRKKRKENSSGGSIKICKSKVSLTVVNSMSN